MIAATGAPLIVNAMSIIANVWFGDGDRNSATAFAGLAAPLGNMISLIITGILFAGYNLEEDELNDGVDLKSRTN